MKQTALPYSNEKMVLFYLWFIYIFHLSLIFFFIHSFIQFYMFHALHPLHHLKCIHVKSLFISVCMYLLHFNPPRSDNDNKGENFLLFYCENINCVFLWFSNFFFYFVVKLIHYLKKNIKLH
jgi:hypothetical protein